MIGLGSDKNSFYARLKTSWAHTAQMFALLLLLSMTGLLWTRWAVQTHFGIFWTWNLGRQGLGSICSIVFYAIASISVSMWSWCNINGMHPASLKVPKFCTKLVKRWKRSLDFKSMEKESSIFFYQILNQFKRARALDRALAEFRLTWIVPAVIAHFQYIFVKILSFCPSKGSHGTNHTPWNILYLV